MKKFTKVCLMFVMLFTVCLALVGCGISQNYADEINEKAKAGEALTKDDVYDHLGKPGAEVVVGGNGYAVWYKGYDTFEEAYTAAKDGKAVKSIRVVFLGGKATGAAYSEGEPSDK